VEEATADADELDTAQPETGEGETAEVETSESDTADAESAEPDSAGRTGEPRDVLSAFDAMILDDVVADEPAEPIGELGEPTESMPAVDESGADDLSAMPPPSAAPSDMPPPVAPVAPGSPTPESEPSGLAPERRPADDLVLDPRAMKALSRQERKDAKAAIRREAKEAREAARRARAEAKADAKADLTDDAESELVSDRPTEHIDPVTEAAELLAEPPADMPPPAVAPPAVTPPAVAPPAETPVSSAPLADMPPPTPSGTDPRSRAAARVQRRLGRDAEKVSAAETRARAREEARRRRVQAKELRTGSAVAEAAEAVVRMPDEQLEATAEIPAVDADVVDSPVVETPVVEDAETEVIPPVAETPAVSDEIDLGEDVPAADDEADGSGDADDDPDFEDVEELEDPEADAAEFVAPSADDPIFDEPAVEDSDSDESESVSTQPVPDDMPAPVVVTQGKRVRPETTAPKWTPEPDEPTKKSGLGPVAGVIGLIALAVSVLLAVSALAVALGVDSGGVYNALKAIADTLVGPLKSAFDFSGSNAERKEHFLAWGAGSLGYLIVSFIGQAVQRANSDDE
jgi:hypothetical protein